MSDAEAVSAEKTLRFDDGRVIMFSADEFANRVCATDCCFVCGAGRDEKPFNDEHVVPRWVLARYNLFDKEILLPNGRSHRYGTYKMPCCVDCNSLLGVTIENPMSEMLDGGFDLISSKLEDPSPIGSVRRKVLYVWLCLLFIKTHLKDRQLREHLDFRQGDARIADRYDWISLHHIHCVARLPYVQGAIMPDVVGTIRWYRIDDPTSVGLFDYYDLTHDQTIALRLGDLGIVAVLTDCGASPKAWYNEFLELQGKTLTMVQLREVAARLAIANRDLINRPVFGTAINRDVNPAEVILISQHDREAHFRPFDRKAYGEVLKHALSSYEKSLLLLNGDQEGDVLEQISSGTVSFLFDESGRLIRRIIDRRQDTNQSAGDGDG